MMYDIQICIDGRAKLPNKSLESLEYVQLYPAATSQKFWKVSVKFWFLLDHDLNSKATSSVPHCCIYIANCLFTWAWLLLISCQGNKLFSFTELGNIVAVIVPNPMYVHTAMGSCKFYCYM